MISGNFISKIIGFARELIFAKIFGTGDISGSFRVAQSSTFIPINFLTSDSLNSAFIPLYRKLRENDLDKSNLLFFLMLFFFSLVSLILIILFFFFSDLVTDVIAPGFNGNTKQLTVDMLKIMSLCCPFFLFSALMNYVSLVNDDYVPMSIRPIVQNVGILFGTIFAFIFNSPLYLAWGFTFSYLIFFVYVAVRIYKFKFINFPQNISFLSSLELICQFWKIIKPLLILPFLLQGNILIERSIASLVSLTAVSALDYAKFVSETAIFFISIPIAFVGLSSWVNIDIDALKNKLIYIFNLLVIITVPISGFIFIYADLIVNVLFERGAFDNESSHVTSIILRGLSLGLWAQVISYILIKALSAQFQNKKVLIIMLLALSSNTLINILFYKWLGAYTLGVGCSVYGMVLLIGALISFKISFKYFINGFYVLIGIVFFKIIFGRFTFDSFHPIIQIVFCALMFLSFIIIWLFLNPYSRKIIMDVKIK